MFERLRRLKSEQGFTLVELLVTTTIIGVLAAVVTVGVSGASSTAQTKANQQLFNSVQAGLDSFSAQNPLSTVPPTQAALGSADSVNYFGSGGTLGGVTAASTDLPLDFTCATVGSTCGLNSAFSTNFRLNNSSGTFKCVVAAPATFTLKACRN